MKQRIISMLLAVLMVITMLPMTAVAEALTGDSTSNAEAASNEAAQKETAEQGNSKKTEPPEESETVEDLEVPGQSTVPQKPEQSAKEMLDNDQDIKLFANETSTDTVTRIAWIQGLVAAFDMTVEEDNYPDNYYTDIDSTADYYRDLMIAVEFGVIDLNAGLPFEPDEPATREFAAHTLNYCLGFQLGSSTYTYTDTASVTYKDDVQVAVNRSWFALVNEKFLPQQAMTSAEAAAMLADAKKILEGTVVSENYNSTYTFKTDVIEIPAGTEVQVEDGVVRITNCPKVLTNGCIFVVYVNEIPVPYIATSVATEGNVTVVTATRAEDADAFEVFDAQGVVDADLTLVEALDGTELSYYVEDLEQEFQTYAMAQAAVAHIGGTKEYKYALSFKKDLSLGNNVSLALDIKVKNLKVSYNINLRQGTAYVGLSCDVTTTFKIKGDFLPATCISDINDIELFYWKIPGVGGFTITYDVKLAGEISGVHESHVSLGIQASVKNGISFPREFETKSFSISIEATMQIGFVARLGVTELPAVSGYFYAKFGIAARLKGTTYKDDRTPKTCIHFGAYLYGNCGVAASISFPAFQYKESFDRRYEIFNERNSPLRIIHHYEDNVLVSSCTRADEFEGDLGRWRTPGTSRYTSSGWSSGFGSKAYDKSGNPVTLYTYTLDDDDNATITAYKGNATAIVIPSKLDGYTVVAVGYGVFQNNNNLRAVTIPDTVTSIGGYAFYACKKLFDVSLSANLVSLGDRSFGNCTSLKGIEIPKTLKTAYAFGPFSGCSALTNVTLEQGMTAVAPNLFYNCSGIVSIKIPDTVTSIGNDAFRNCDSLKNVEIPDSVTEIKTEAFRECANLEEIVIPDSVTSMESYIFYSCKKLSDVRLPNTRQNIMQSMFQDCTSLKTITLPDTVTTIQMNAFSGCTALETIAFPDSLTSIQGSAFSNCSSLKNVTWGKNLTSIDSSAFSNCDSLTTVILSDSVTKLGTNVFYDCDALTSVKLGSGITTLPESTFEHCDALESIVIPRRVTTIGNNAFKNCVKFTSITIPRSVTSIDGTAFSYPARMTIYGVTGTYAETFADENSIKFVDKQVNADVVTLGASELVINKGTSATLNLIIEPEDYTDAVSWKSSNTSVATISDTGVVKGVGVGTATIKVIVGSKSASCKVTVQQPVTSISLNKTSLTLEALATYQLTATANPSTADDRRISWSSSAPDIASVDENGLVTAHKKGTAAITASAIDGSGVTKTCTVAVSNTAYICTTVEEIESPHNYPDNCKDVWVYTLSGAEELFVTFDEQTNIEDDFDYLYMYDMDGKLVGKYTGIELAGKTITVHGDTVQIKLVSDESGNTWGFKVTRVAGGAVAGTIIAEGDGNDIVTLILKQGDRIVESATSADGTYRLLGLANGTYMLEASKIGCVTHRYTVTIKDGQIVNTLNIELVARGNINGVASAGSSVDATDMECLYTLLSTKNYVGQIRDEEYVRLVSDINNDGVVNILDYQRLYMALTGAAPLT